jgi:hypothetical protein
MPKARKCLATPGNRKENMVLNETSMIREHYAKCWGVDGNPKRWSNGPVCQLPTAFQVLVFPPFQQRTAWIYATCGMSSEESPGAIELHLMSPNKTDLHVELLTTIAHYHFTGAPLGADHTVNFGRPWLPGSSCDHGLISLPYLYGPRLEWLKMNDRKIQFLWLIPITPSEATFKRTHGVEALETRFEEQHFDYLDSHRGSVA